MVAPNRETNAPTLPSLDVDWPYYLRLILPGKRHYGEYDPLIVNTHLSEDELFKLHFGNRASLYNAYYTYQTYGYPFRSLGYMNKPVVSQDRNSPLTPEPRWYYRGIPLEPRSSYSGRNTLPVMMYSTGFIANSLIYAISIFGFRRGWRALLAIRRRARGSCVGCGYMLEHLANCPECGTSRE